MSYEQTVSFCQSAPTRRFSLDGGSVAARCAPCLKAVWPAKASSSIVKKKNKSLRPGGDQQKLKRGHHVIKAAIAEARVQTGSTKGINARIEKTMTARTGGDGGQLHILKDQDDGAPLGASLKSASFSKTQKRK